MLWIVGYALAGMIVAAVALAFITRNDDQQVNLTGLVFTAMFWPLIVAGIIAAVIFQSEGGRK